MTLSAARRVYLLGGVILVALTRNLSDMGGPRFVALLAAAGIAYLLAVREFFATPRFPRHVVVIGLILAALWHLHFLRMPSGIDDDIHRYVWDGRIQRLGYNPYLVVPSDPAARGLHTAETRSLNNPDLPSPYPAGAQLFFRGVTAIHESTFAMKVAFEVCDLAIIFVLLDFFRRVELGAHLVLAYAWNPLLAIEVAGTGHIDIVGALMLLVSFAALRRRWRTTAAVAFALAVSVKLLPLVLLPLYWKRVRLRDAAIGAALVALLYLPFLDHGRIPTGSLGTYVQSFRFNDPLFRALERWARPQVAAGAAVLIGLLTATWMRVGVRTRSPDAFAWPMAASLLWAPVVYPWYLLWLLPLLWSASTLPITIWTVSIVPTYVVWHLRTLGRPWLVPDWIMLLEYGAVTTASILTALHQPTRPAGPQRSMDHSE